MDQELAMTRRAALQGMAGMAAAAMLPGNRAAQAQKGVNRWPDISAMAPAGVRPFNDDWRFHRGDVSGGSDEVFDHSQWRTLDVPHDWSIEDLPPATETGTGAIWSGGTTPQRTGPFDMYASEGQVSTGWTVGGVGWYRKTFDRPQVPAGGRVELRFEGVYMNCDVWLNGAHLGNHPYGYTEFAFDITPHLKEGKNGVAVRVNNTGRNSRWYSGSGIFRKVWLGVAGELRIPVHGVYVTTPEVSRDAALVNVEVTVENGAATPKRANVRVRLVDAEGTVAGEVQAPVSLPANGNTTAACIVRLKNPRLWSPADPQLYRTEVMLGADGKVADATALQAGVRKIEIDA